MVGIDPVHGYWQAYIETHCVKILGGTLRFQAQYLKQIRVPRPNEITAVVADALRGAFRIRDVSAATAAAALAYGIDDLPEGVGSLPTDPTQRAVSLFWTRRADQMAALEDGGVSGGAARAVGHMNGIRGFVAEIMVTDWPPRGVQTTAAITSCQPGRRGIGSM